MGEPLCACGDGARGHIRGACALMTFPPLFSLLPNLYSMDSGARLPGSKSLFASCELVLTSLSVTQFP